MSIRTLGWIVPAALCAGCIESHHPELVATPPPAVPLAPTSDRPGTPSVYAVPGYPGWPSPPPANPPPGVDNTDVQVAQEVGALLKDDPNLSGPSSNVVVTVNRGVVTLRGTVAAEHDRDEMVERIAKLPGVTGVNNKLGVDLR